jgi:hypothetical protein
MIYGCPMDSDAAKPWIVWVNYHSEGWAPTGFDSEQAALDFVENGPSQPVVVTRRRVLASRDAEGSE